MTDTHPRISAKLSSLLQEHLAATAYQPPGRRYWLHWAGVAAALIAVSFWLGSLQTALAFTAAAVLLYAGMAGWERLRSYRSHNRRVRLVVQIAADGSPVRAIGDVFQLGGTTHGTCIGGILECSLAAQHIPELTNSPHIATIGLCDD